MTRRVFIGSILATLTILVTSSFQFSNTKKRFHVLIKNLWPWLDFDPEAITEYTTMCQIQLSLALMLESKPVFHNILQNRMRIFREKLTSQFLLSTDFFQEGMNEGRSIKYALYYDPYINPCYNPRP